MLRCFLFLFYLPKNVNGSRAIPGSGLSHVYPCKHLKFCNDKELSPSSARPCYVCFYGPQKDLLSAFGIAAECFLSHGESFASVLFLSVCLIAVRNLCCASEEAQKQDFAGDVMRNHTRNTRLIEWRITGP